MCGRYVLNINPDQIASEFGATPAASFEPNYNVSPTQSVAVITNEDPHQLTQFRWGLVPSWAKDLSMGAKMINARSESVDEKPAFRAAYKRRRCLIPANGFYEWRMGDDGKKTPMYIHLKDRELFAFAGLWEVWRSPDGEVLRTCSIITTDANEFMQAIHNRMPVILARDAYERWLTPEDATPALKELLQPYDSSKMTAYEVSRAVNRAGYSSPELIEPASAPPRLL